MPCPEPENLPDLVSWFHSAWIREAPSRLHEAGTEPDSILGSPRLAGAFRSYIMGSSFATDHDDRLDMTTAGDCRLYPIHAAMIVLSHKWPLSARFLFAIAWTGASWQDVSLAWRMLPEVGHRFAESALRHLWRIWARNQGETAREVA